MGLIFLASRQNHPRDAGEFVGQCDGGEPERLFLHEVVDPSSHWCVFVLRMAHDGSGSDNQ